MPIYKVFRLIDSIYFDFRESYKLDYAKLNILAYQNLSVKGIKTCVFHGLKHACFAYRNMRVSHNETAKFWVSTLASVQS